MLISGILKYVAPFLKGSLKEVFKENKVFNIVNAGLKEVQNKKEEINKKTENIININNLKVEIQKYFKDNDNHDIYIFIDDLDRCNPNFNIKLFEV
jgi:predicted KAP-like P-loop ATPase